MKIISFFCDCLEFLKRRFFLISWISLVIYLFYDTFIYYKHGRQFHHLRKILGLGLYTSRGTATVLNLCCALILLPLCKKLNQVWYRILSKLWPGLFFFWLEKAKSFHMTVAVTLLLFAVLHSISHFVNLWNFSRGYDEEWTEINFANYRGENPIFLLLTMTGVSGVSMLIIVLCMGATSMRIVRRRVYNAFWYMHQLYLPFVVLLIIHPLSGVLKEEVIEETSQYSSHIKNWTTDSIVKDNPKFIAIKSKTWLWISLPVSCFVLDLLWRIFTRNRARVDILEVSHMAGRTLSVSMSCPHERFVCRAGQYVLLQCLDASLIEWHPFTVVKVPTPCQRNFVVWIRVKGDWTETLEKLLLEKGINKLSTLVDGPFCSPMERVSRSEVALCVAAGVGITPFLTTLHHMLMYPRSRLPGRIHLLWIVRHEKELTWIAKLANKTLLTLRNANRPDRLHLELYVTSTEITLNHIITVNEKGGLTHLLDKVDEKNGLSHLSDKVNEKNGLYRLSDKVDEKNGLSRLLDKVDEKNGLAHLLDKVDEKNGLAHLLDKVDEKKGLAHLLDKVDEKNGLSPFLDRVDEKATLLTPHMKRAYKVSYEEYDVAKEYPLLGCRVRRGRPHWDRVFGYWVHLYPEDHLNLYCCGPKKLVKTLRSKCKQMSRDTKTKFSFVHEGFS